MATNRTLVDKVLDEMPPLEVSAKSMFGEYSLDLWRKNFALNLWQHSVHQGHRAGREARRARSHGSFVPRSETGVQDLVGQTPRSPLAGSTG
jgi:hypothetical protein